MGQPALRDYDLNTLGGQHTLKTETILCGAASFNDWSITSKGESMVRIYRLKLVEEQETAGYYCHHADEDLPGEHLNSNVSTYPPVMPVHAS